MVVSNRRKEELNNAFVLKKKENEKKKVDETMNTGEDECEEKDRKKKDEREKRRMKREENKRYEVRKRKSLHNDTDESAEGENESAYTEINREAFIKHTEQNKKSWMTSLAVAITGTSMLVAVTLFVFIVILPMHDSGKTDAPSYSKKDYFQQQIASLKATFPTQTPYLWKLVGSASIDFIESENPKRPAVILLAGGPDAHRTLDDLASGLSNSYVNGTESVTEIHRTQCRNKDPHAAKKCIDETLRSGFDNGGQVAVVHNLESIPAEASMIFHSYCENDNAPFKRVVIIFTVYMTEELNPKDRVKVNEKKVERHLEEQWKEAVGKDHVKAMFSRVATATAFVTAP